MTNLPLDISACAYEKKDEVLCSSCSRNLNQWDITQHTLFSEFKPTKNMKTKILKCEGYRK